VDIGEKGRRVWESISRILYNNPLGGGHTHNLGCSLGYLLTEWGYQEEVSQSRGTTVHHRRVARKSSEVRQESEAEQSRRKDIGEECSAPRGKCAAKGRIIWRKGGQIM